MARVLLVSDSPFIHTGLANVARTIGVALHAAGHTVFHSAFSDPRPSADTTKYGGNIIPWKVLQTQKGGPDFLTGSSSFNKHFMAADPDVIITVADPWNCAHYVLYAPCPVIMMLHVEAEPIPTRIDSAGPRVNLLNVLQAASIVITAGPFGRASIQRRLLELAKTPPVKGPEEIRRMLNNSNHIIPDGIDTHVFSPMDPSGLKAKMFKGLKDDAFVIGYFGRQNPRKGLPYILEAFSRWPNRPKNVWIYLHTALQDRIGWNVPTLLHDYNVGENVILDPNIKVGMGCSNETLNALYNACFIAGTQVRTKQTYVPIESIKEGDLVYSATGNLRKVLATSRRIYVGKLATITTNRDHIGTTCTVDHPFLVYNGSALVRKEAGKLRPGDLLVAPVHLEGDSIISGNPQGNILISQETALKKKKRVDSSLQKDKDGNLFVVERRFNIYLPIVEINKVPYIISVVEGVTTRKDTTTVFNIEVDVDHSYLANGIAVKNCDITVLPSTGEGAGLTLLESLSAGTPTVTTDYAEAPNYVRGVADLIRPVGFWVEPVTNFRRAIPDVDQLSHRMRKLYQNREKLPEIGARGREHIVRNYDIGNISKQWIQLVDDFSKRQKQRKEAMVHAGPDMGSKKKVLFVGSHFLPDLIGGGEITWLKILQRFQANGWQPYVYIARTDIAAEEIIDIDGISVIRNNKTGFEQKLHAHMSKIRPDIVMTTLIDPKITQVALQFSREVGATSVYYEQFYNTISSKYTDVMNLQPKHMVPWGKDILTLSNIVYSNGEFLQKVLKKYHDIDTKILHPYINLAEVQVQTQERKYVTMINPDPGKGGDTAVYMAKNMPDVEFLFVKVASNSKYENIPTDLPNLTVWEFQTDVRKIYEKSKVILMPTVVDETFGRVIIEAQSNGIPIIGRDVGNISTTMGKGGVLIPRLEDDDVWCDTLRALLSDSTVYDRLSESAKENVKRFDFDKELEDFYNHVTTQAKPEVKKRKICVITPNFPGVLEVYNTCQKLWPKDVAVVVIEGLGNGSRILNVVKNMEPTTVIFGAWIPIFEEVMNRIRQDFPNAKIVASWFSNFSQMEYSPNNELGLLSNVRKKLEKKEIDEIWLSGADTANILNKQNTAMRYMPCPVFSTSAKPTIPPDPNKIRISLFCSPGPRKNLAAQIAACAEIPNVELHVNGLTKHAQYKDLIDLLKIPCVDHGWMSKSDYLGTVASMDIGLQVTFAETFNYVVAEHMIQGVPILGSDMTAIMNLTPELKDLQVSHPDDPGFIAQKIREVLGDRQHYSQLVSAAIQQIQTVNNQQLKEMLDI